ncbi:MAG: A24 family peptidase [Alphaproteobacteria bacterium]
MSVAILGAFAALFVAAAISDLSRYIIPNAISIALVVLFAAAALAGDARIDWISHLGAAVAIFAIGAVLFRFGALGGGDVKLLAAASLWMGFAGLLPYLFVVALAGGALTLLLLALRFALPRAWGVLGRGVNLRLPTMLTAGARVPYGVAIAAGALVMAPRLPILSLSGLG